MANIIYARVMQKTATLDEWMSSDLVLLDGEQAFIIRDDGTPLNFRIGDGSKKFSELPDWIAYEQGTYVPVAGSALPTLGAEIRYTWVGPGTYTQSGGPDIVVPSGHMGILSWDGSVWSLSQAMELSLNPVIKRELEGLKNKGLLEFETYLNSDGVEVSSTSSKTTNYIPCSGINKLRVVFPIWSNITSGTGLAFYNESKEFMSFVPALYAQNDYGFEERIIEVPENARYFRTSYWNGTVTEEYNFPDFYVYADNLLLELSDINNKVESLETVIGGIGFTLDESSLTIKGSAIGSNGVFSSSSSFSDRTDYIKCEGVAKFNILFQITDGSPQFYNLAFYDQDKIFISSIPANTGDVRGSEVRTIDVPTNAHYFVAQYWNEERRIEYNVPNFYAYAITQSISDLQDKIDSISSGLNPMYTQEDLTLKNRFIRYINDENLGEVASSTSSDSTGFLTCNNFSKLTLMQPVWTSGSTGVGFYNKDFELISYINNRSGVTNTSYETTIEVPENAYYFRTTYWNKETIEQHNLPEFYVAAGTLAENINYLNSIVRTTSLGGSYVVSFTEEKIIVTNVVTNGSITFDLIGSDTLSGNYTDDEVLKGGKLIRKVEDEFKVMNVTFDLMSESAPLQIYTHTTYKVDTEIEKDGIEGICSGDVGFLKDVNVFVEGNPMIAGFTDEAKTKFALCADYGSMTPHYSKLEEVKYTDIDVVKGERKFAKLSVLKEESPLRLLNQPNGYNATFTFASHADRSTIPVTKAIFYGTDDESSPTYDTNGLLSYGIKGTMSVFAEGHTSTHAALDNATFKALIDDAYSKGIEIIPHTITYDPDTRADAERVLPFFKNEYNSRNWIDHFLRQDNPSIGHHSKGNDPASPHYIMDLMEQYGYEYTWSYVDTTPDGVIREQLFEEHYQFRRDLLFKNKKLTFPDGTPMWQYKNTWKVFESIMGGSTDAVGFVQDLIDSCGVWSDHPYLTATYGQLWKEVGGVISIDPKFDQMLAFVRDKKEAGEIWNPTQSEYNDNLAKLMDISIVRSGVGQYKVFSKNEENVNCSFLLKNTFKDVYLNGVLAESKVTGDNMIFWGDIKQGENTITVS